MLAIQRGPVQLDASPEALISLKSAGVSDQVLNTILAAANSTAHSTDTQNANAKTIFNKAIAAIGPQERLKDVHATLVKQTATRLNQGKSESFSREILRAFPDRIHIGIIPSSGTLLEEVVTSTSGYRTSGDKTSDLPPAYVETARSLIEFDVIYVAQHPEQYTVSLAGTEHIGNAIAQTLSISKAGTTVIWGVDSDSSRLLFIRQKGPSGAEAVTEYSDYRAISGLYRPYKSTVTESGVATDFVTQQFIINPQVDDRLFQRPVGKSTQAVSASSNLTIRVLQEQSVPYVQESGGGISTACSIVGNSNTTAYANSVGNSTFGNATTNSSQRMSCNSYDTTMRWPHVLNVMFAQASNGNSYIFACDRAWRWSKCVPLRAGDTFNARFTEKGLEVESVNSKGKEEKPTYHILQSAVSR